MAEGKKAASARKTSAKKQPSKAAKSKVVKKATARKPTDKKAALRKTASTKATSQSASKKNSTTKQTSRKKQTTSKKTTTPKNAAKTSTRRRQSKKNQKNKKQSWLKRLFIFSCKLSLILLVLIGCYATYLNVQITDKFTGRTFDIPATVFAKALDLYEGKTLSQQELLWHLNLLGYKQTNYVDQPGEFQVSGAKFDIYVRDFQHWDQSLPAKRIHIHIANGQISKLQNAIGQALVLHKLEPQQIGELYANEHKRQLISIEQLPSTLVAGLIAVEDRHFYEHVGLSPTAIARAALTNLSQGSKVQGGSTLTQQLVKNLFLYNKRSWWRKFNEAIMALLVDWQYSKDEILQAYINEVYYAQQSGKALHGFALASRYFFATDVQHLQLHQQALLIALIKGPYYYHPVKQPQRALERRNLVLEVMLQQNIISQTQLQHAQAQPLAVQIEVQQSRPSDFLQLVKLQLDQHYSTDDLAKNGIQVFTSFEPYVHHLARQSLRQQLKQVAANKNIALETIQAAIVVTDTSNANIRTVIGSNTINNVGFNRALNAKRPIGSLIKPFIYAQALQSNRYHLASALDDQPISIALANGELWQPQNYDKRSHGTPSLLQSLAHSYNLATVHLSQQQGLKATANLLEQLGLDNISHTQPSLALGALDLSPLQVANLYQVFANNGFLTPLNAVLAVRDDQQRLLQRHQPAMKPIFDAQTMYLMQYALNHTMRAGTGRSAYQTLPEQWVLAGKTGTSNQARDSWFVGYAENSLAAIWLGADDNRALGLSGSAGALKVWIDLFAQLPLTRQRQSEPNGIQWHWIDQQTLKRTDDHCAQAILVPFKQDQLPSKFQRCY